MVLAKRNNIFIAFGAVLLMLLVAACGNSAVTGGSGANEDGPIKIGVVGPLSGGSALFGKEFPIGAGLAVEWLKKEGDLGDRKIELLTVDDQGDPATAVAGVRELVDKGVHIFVGTVNSPVALALGPLMEKTDSVLLTTASHASEVTHENFSKNVFRITDGPYMRQVGQAKLAAEVAPDVKKWSLVGPNHSYGISTIKSFLAGLHKYEKDASVAKPVLAPFAAADYRSSMSRLVSQKPQGVFSSLYASDAVTAYKQAQAMGLWDNTLLMDSANEFFVARAMKEDTPDHWTAFHWYHGAYDNEMSEFITKEYTDKYNREPTGFVGESFTSILAIVAAMEKGDGSTKTDDLIANLEGLKWDTPSNEREIRAADHQTIKDVNFVRLRGCDKCESGYEVVEFKVMSGADLIEPATPGKAQNYGPGTDF